MPSNRRLLSPPGRTGSLARGSYGFRKRPLRLSRCENGVLALVPRGARGLYEVPAIEHKACPPTMGGEAPRAPVTVLGEVLGCQRVRDCIGKEVGVR